MAVCFCVSGISDMKKLLKISVSILLAVLAGFVLLKQTPHPEWNAPTELPARYRRQLWQEFQQAAALLKDLPEDTDLRETALSNAGLAVLDTDENYPEYLSNPDSLLSFCESSSSKKQSTLSILRVLDGTRFRHIFFLREQAQTLFFSTDLLPEEDGSVSVLSCEVLPVYDMELTDWGIFYYRLYPADDPHYIDYAQIRTQCVDKDLYDLTRTYILPVGYQMVNIFLTDWQERNWNSLSFHDLLEFLYQRNTGTVFFWEDYPREQYPRIPAQVFEDTILPYFQISREELRSHCNYDDTSGTYPWRPVHGNDLTVWHYPMCEPEVVSCTENPDGTLTLNVQVYCPDLKTDRLFCHSLTIRRLSEASFQYVSNQVTYVSDRGLPPNMPRFALDH